MNGQRRRHVQNVACAPVRPPHEAAGSVYSGEIDQNKRTCMADGTIFRRPPKGTQPEYLHPPYASTQKRAPTRPLVLLPHTLSELSGPVFGDEVVKEGENDLTRQ